MKKNIIISILIIIVLIIAIIFSFIFISQNRNKPEQNQNPVLKQTEKKQTDSKILEFAGRPRDFLTKKETLKCNFSSYKDEIKIEGIAYVDNGKLLQDFSIKEGESKSKMQILTIENNMYTWNSEEDKSTAILDTSENNTKNGIMSMLFRYECSPWRADESKFEIPNIPTEIDLATFKASTTLPVEE